MESWIVPSVLAAVALLALVLCALLWAGRRRTTRELGAAHAETAQLRVQVEEIQRALDELAAPRAADTSEYLITDLGRDEEAGAAPVPATVDTRLFADLVLRESVVKAASLAHGLRRGLAAESRNRIRFEMRRELRRARRQRRVDTREAVREWKAKHRADLPGESGLGSGLDGTVA
jgi:hypothetical protein